jgi:flagellar L-ring protein precursor FlgH
MRVAILFLILGQLAAADLWQAESLADGNLYSDQVARRSGDLITILVKETTSVTDNQKTENKRDNDLSLAVEMLPDTAAIKAVKGASTAGRLPAIELESERKFKGEGKYTANGEVRAVITGRVVDVLDNGNLVIEGRRSVRVNLDMKTIIITGIIRTADVQSDNTVFSEKLHGFNVAIEGEGPMTRSQQEGWMARLFDVVWPW